MKMRRICRNHTAVSPYPVPFGTPWRPWCEHPLRLMLKDGQLVNPCNWKNYTPLLEYSRCFLKFSFNKCKNLSLFNFSTHSFFSTFPFLKLHWKHPQIPLPPKAFRHLRITLGIPDISSPSYKSLATSYHLRISISVNMLALAKERREAKDK